MRVLVAEDVRRLADDITEGLRDQGIAADVAYDGADAVFKLDLNPYDVLVLDRDLPGVHGDTICRTITATGNPVMILMLTAAGTPTTGSPAWPWAPTTTCPSPSTSPSSCCASAPWPVASLPPGPVSCARPG